ncbi:MAG TPA: B12-binding domain-containing protein [Gaiella sp.]|nr:B12-binding domain-containing protein [Gaiella sp.]
MSDLGLFRIGELSRRSGVSPELLRAWERRYSLLQPTRSPGGLRLYSAHDVERVEAMRQHLAAGFAAAEAAALALRIEQDTAEDSAPPSAARAELAAALAAFDEAAAHAVVDTLLARMSLDALLSDVIVPYLHELGDRWDRGEVSVAQEHFASNVLRGRLLGLARGWGRGLGPRVVLACAPGEQHDLGLITFGLALRARGWRIVYLGADTPLASVADAAHACDPRFVVVSAVAPRAFRSHRAELAELATRHRLCLGGAGANGANLGADVEILTGGPVDEAERLTQLARALR